MPNPIVHFEIPAEDVQRAKKFYETAFGWKISDPWNMDYFFVETKEGGDGINGGLMKRSMEGQPFMNYIAVESIDVIATSSHVHGLTSGGSDAARVASVAASAIVARI